jgi:hypothetical protein
MHYDKEVILKQIDELLDSYTEAENKELTIGAQLEWRTRLSAAVERFASPNSAYLKQLASLKLGDPSDWWKPSSILKALRNDYQAGNLRSVLELIHSDVFSDFLEMAAYLLAEGYKDPAAVIAGTVLEEHLRKLCDKNSIPTQKPTGEPKKADALNAELAGANVYSKLDLKNVTAWLDLRNKAAHVHYAEYTKEQVVLLIQSIRDFITRNPA